MGQTTIRIPDELLQEIDKATEAEETRSEWIREACRERVDSTEPEIEERIEEIEERVGKIEAEIEQPFWKKWW